MNEPSALRFFAVTLRPHTLTVVLVLGVFGTAWWSGRHDAHGVEQALVLALLLQMFTAATGFREPARRGHFDALLASRRSRLVVGLAHAAISMAPGVALWAILSCVALALSPSAWPTALSPSALAALFYVSAAAWAASLPLVRYSTGVLWLATLFVLAGTGHIHALRAAYLAAGAGWTAAFSGGSAALACPLFFLTDAGAAHIGETAACTGAVGFLTAGLAYICRLDVPLSDPP